MEKLLLRIQFGQDACFAGFRERPRQTLMQQAETEIRGGLCPAVNYYRMMMMPVGPPKYSLMNNINPCELYPL